MHARVKGARRPLFESAARPNFFRPPLCAWAPPAARIRISFLLSSFVLEEISGRLLDREKKRRLTPHLFSCKSGLFVATFNMGHFCAAGALFSFVLTYISFEIALGAVLCHCGLAAREKTPRP